MFPLLLIVATEINIFTSAAILTYRDKSFSVILETRIVFTLNLTSTKTPGSLIECGMICAMLDNCCNASYYDGHCLSNSNCNPVTETYLNSVVMQEMFHGDCKTDDLGQTYSGKINTTVTGRVCQAWALDSPHSHSFNHSLDNNYCRNPSGSYPGPWCYTTDTSYRWDFCPVYTCGKSTKMCGYGFYLCNNGQCIPDNWRCNGLSDCPDSDDEIPECLEDDAGLTYRGKMNKTISGIPCQHWSSQSPHPHSTHCFAAENYCRNFDPDKTSPWCYTLNSTIRWDYCNITDCD